MRQWQKLLQKTNLSLQTAIDMCRALEFSKHQTNSINQEAECELGKIGKPPGGKFLPKDSEEKITSWRQTVDYQRHVRGVEDLIHWENAQLLENLSKMQKSEPLCISVSLKECSFHGNWSSCSSCCRRRATRRIILRLSPKEMTMSKNEKYLFKSTTTL